MSKSAALLGSVTLLYTVAISGGCSSNPASSAPTTDSGGMIGLGATGPEAAAGTGGAIEANLGGHDPSHTGGAPVSTGGLGTTGDTGGSGTSTDQGGTGSGATAPIGGTGNHGTGGSEDSGGSSTVDPYFGGHPTSTGGRGSTEDIVGGTGNTEDIVGGTGNTEDVVGGTGNTEDVVGGTGNTEDLVGGTGNTEDLIGGTGNTEDNYGGTGNTQDHFGGTGNTHDGVGGIPIAPPPPDSGPPPPGCIPTWFAKGINVLVLHDAYMGGADTRGGLWVGGNLTAPGGYDVGGDLPPDPSCTRYDLAVGGNIKLGGSLVMHSGAAAYGGTLTANSVAGAACGIFKNPANMPNFAQIAADVKGNTSYFAGLPPTGTVSGTSFQGANASCKIVVFNTTLCTFDWHVVIDIPANGTAIINSSCTNPSFLSGPPTVKMGGVAQPICTGQQGTGGSCDRVLYNFPNATTVTVNQTVQGSILAPYAKFIGQGANVDGEVVVDSMDNTGGVEFHAWFFEGCLDTTTC